MSAMTPQGWSLSRRLPAAAGLAGLAVLGNMAHLPLFFGVDLIFGSVAALVALVWLGPAAGIAAAAAGGAYTLYLWGHPYALLLLTLEVAVAALLVRRGWYLVVAVGLYWLVLGGPLAFLLYSQVLDMAPTAAGLIALKQPVNGVLNATLAGLLLLGLQTFLAIAPPGQPAGHIRLRHLLFSLFVTVALLPGVLLMAAEGWNHRVEQERALARQMALAAHAGWRDEQTTLPGGLNLHAADAAAEGGRATTAPGLRLHLPPAGDRPAMVRWKRAHYSRTIDPEGMEREPVRVTAPAAGVVQRLRSAQLRQLGLLAVLALTAAGLAGLLSRWLTRPVEGLDRAAAQLPEQIHSGGELPAFPSSRIRELAALSEAVADMGRALTDNLRSSEAARTELEAGIRERTAALERHNAELRRLAEVAAHHLQEPARRATAFAQRLRRQLASEPPDLPRLEEQLAEMVALLGDLQGYLAYQTRTPQPTNLPLGEAVAEARQNLGDTASGLVITTDPDPLPTVRADPNLLQALLHHLLANAVRYCRPEVSPAVHITATRRDRAWEIAVADNGRGMETAYLERVFRLFERLYPSQDTEGTGVGLSLARLIVERHGGWIRAESNGPDTGTTIRFTLPDQPTPPEGGPTPTEDGEA